MQVLQLPHDMMPEAPHLSLKTSLVPQIDRLSFLQDRRRCENALPVTKNILADASLRNFSLPKPSRECQVLRFGNVLPTAWHAFFGNLHFQKCSRNDSSQPRAIFESRFLHRPPHLTQHFASLLSVTYMRASLDISSSGLPAATSHKSEV